jgi:hypothetical protein
VDEGERIISGLSGEDPAALAQQRSLIEPYLGNEESRRKYEEPVGKLGLLRALLENKVFSPEQTYELQSMGVVLGDVFAQELGKDGLLPKTLSEERLLCGTRAQRSFFTQSQ